MHASKLQPALLGGTFIGVLSTLPIVQMGNCCCCLWVVSGGFLAAYLLQGNSDTPITAADGAVAGLLSGVIGAVIGFVLGLVLAPFVGPLMERLQEQARENARNLPPAFQDAFGAVQDSGLAGGAVGMAFQVIGFFVNLVIYSIVATLGGLLGAALIKKPAPPAPPPGMWTPPPPPTWTPPPPPGGPGQPPSL